MRVLKLLLLGSCALLLMFTVIPNARAGVWDQTVITTFSNPVEIPGQILPSGTYVFKIVNVVGKRDIVQVSNADESHVFATAFTVTRYRPKATAEPVFVFEERGMNSPPAVQAWFYPGYIDGHQFIYRSRVASESMSAGMATTTTTEAAAPAVVEESAPVMSAEANSTEVEGTPSTTEATEAPEVQAAPETTAPAPAPAELPKTASTTPLIGLIGTLLLAAALGLKMLASRV